MLIEMNDQNYKSILDTDKLVVIDLYANWCGPCKAMLPKVEEAAKEIESVVITKVRCEDNPEITNYFKISSVPTVIFIKNNVEIFRHHGFMPDIKQTILDFLEVK